MPALTAVEKILARKSGKAAVRPGDVVSPDPDFIMIHDKARRVARDIAAIELALFGVSHN